MAADKLTLSSYNPATSAPDLLQQIVEIQRLADEAVSALVVRQRSQGDSLAEAAHILDLTEDRLRKKYVPRDVDRSLSNRSRPRPAPLTQTAPAAPGTPAQLRWPRQRMACALTRMKHGSGRLQSEIARRLKVDQSYVSRMLSGERDVSWQYVLAICDVCGGDPTLMKPLWDTAAGVPPSGDAVLYLRTYLQALRYANGSPSFESILQSTQGTITADDLRQALKGPGFPPWHVVSPITTALLGLPDTVRPLWRRAQTAFEAAPEIYS
ncbi:helix-turn-helix domain-containing protein [Streptomyces griseoviridis]|uniref:helix-turn-helix domain-containing protein n=1 Tax=Streptomyces griseoviridis TaxID=45398 RepID=UPI0033DEB26D